MPTPPTSLPRVVLIDDDADSRELFAEYLRYEGFDVVEFENAEDALAAVARDLPAVIVTDLTLTGMSGCEAARRIRADVRTRGLPLLAVTGRYAHDLREDRKLFDGVMVKPVEAAKLVESVRALLARSDKPGG